MGLKSLRRISLRVWYSGFGMQDAGLVRISALGGSCFGQGLQDVTIIYMDVALRVRTMSGPIP